LFALDNAWSKSFVAEYMPLPAEAVALQLNQTWPSGGF
jgi:hypothetical protein